MHAKARNPKKGFPFAIPNGLMDFLIFHSFRENPQMSLLAQAKGHKAMCISEYLDDDGLLVMQHLKLRKSEDDVLVRKEKIHFSEILSRPENT